MKEEMQGKLSSTRGWKNLLEGDSAMETPMLAPHLIVFATMGKGWEAEYYFQDYLFFSCFKSFLINEHIYLELFFF